ncbi:MAG: tetratricopeptide repeat protein [Planctomycetota bacterium]
MDWNRFCPALLLLAAACDSAPVVRAEVLPRGAFSHYREAMKSLERVDTVGAASSFREAEHLAQVEDDTFLRRTCLFELARLHTRAGNLPAARRMNEACRELSPPGGDRLSWQADMLSAELWDGDPVAAVGTLEERLPALVEDLDELARAAFHLQRGVLYRKAGNGVRAREDLLLARDLFAAEASPEGLAASHAALATLEYVSNHKNEARNHWERARDLDRALRRHGPLASDLAGLAKIEAESGREGNALLLRSQALQIHLELGNKERALQDARECLRLCEKLNLDKRAESFRKHIETLDKPASPGP